MFKSIQRIFSFLMICCAGLLAHEDDRGEITPNIFVVADKFEAFFKNNRTNKAYKEIYSTVGIILERKEINVENYRGRIINRSQLFLKSKQPAIVEQSEKSIFHAFYESESHKILVYTVINQIKEEQSEDVFVKVFKLGLVKPILKVTLERAIVSMSSVRVSNIVVKGSYAYFAWMQRSKDQKDPNVMQIDTDVVLTRLDLVKGTTKDKVIYDGNWNSRPNIALFENTLAIASHTTPNYSKREADEIEAKVIVKTCDLKKVFK